MNKWFHRIPQKNQTRIFKYLDKLKDIKDQSLKVETMMNKTKYHYEFCEECVEAWNEAQDKKSIREIDDKNGQPSMEFKQEELFG